MPAPGMGRLPARITRTGWRFDGLLFDDADAFWVEGDEALAEEESGGLFVGAFGCVEFLADEGWRAFV